MALEAAGNRSAEAVPERIARELRAAIDAGQYPPGMLLPSEKTIGIELGASGPTVREGLAILGAEGRVRSVTGKGTFVQEPPVPRHLIEFDPADPWHGLTAAEEPQRSRGAASARASTLLGVPLREFIHIVEQAAIHETGALVSVRRILPHCAYDGMERYPDPAGEREPIIKALSDAHGPLTYEGRYGAVIPDTDDRTALKITGIGAVGLHALAITRAADHRGLMLDILCYNAAETDVTAPRR